MNDGHYTNIRNYLEEIASQQKQLLTAVQRTNELLLQQASNYSIGQSVKPGVPRIPADAVGPVVVETVETVDEATPKTAAKKAAKKNNPKPDVSPQVNWNSRSE